MRSNSARIGLLAALAAVAVVLFIVLSGDDDSDSDVDATVTQEATTGTATTQTPAAPTATIEITGGQPVGGVEEIEVIKGDDVRIQITSDTTGEIHVQGYEIEKRVEAGGTTQVAFPADLDGVFEIELHLDGSEAQIAELPVQSGE